MSAAEGGGNRNGKAKPYQLADTREEAVREIQTALAFQVAKESGCPIPEPRLVPA